MRKLAVVLALSALVIPSPARADVTHTGDYVIALPYGVYTDTRAGLGIGGFIFPAGGKPVKIKVADATGNTVSVRVCQDVDRSGVCDDNERFKFCAAPNITYDIPQFGQPWNTTTNIAVFVRSMVPSECGGNPASSGRITLTTR